MYKDYKTLLQYRETVILIYSFTIALTFFISYLVNYYVVIKLQDLN